MKIYILRLNRDQASGLELNPRGLWISRPTPSQRPWSCIFRNWSRFSLKMYIFTTLEFTTPYFKFRLLTTSVNAKYYQNKFLSCNSNYLDNNSFFYAGELIAMSVVHGGAGPRCFGQPLYDALTKGVRQAGSSKLGGCI